MNNSSEDLVEKVRQHYASGNYLETRKIAKNLIKSQQASDDKSNQISKKDLAQVQRILKAISFDPIAVIVFAISIGVLLCLIFIYAV